MKHTAADTLDPLRKITPEFLQNPYPVYDRLRQNAPIFRSDVGKYWLVTGHSVAKAVLRDSRFGKKPALRTFFHHLVYFWLSQLAVGKTRKDMMLNQDPPDHTRMRSLVNAVFTPSAVARLAPLIENIADDLLNVVSASGHMDVINDYAFPLPIAVIAQILGVPTEDREQFKDCSNRLISGFEPPFDYKKIIGLGKVNKACRELIDYFGPVISTRRKTPQQDLISALILAQEDGKRLSDNEILATSILLLLAGHETTVNLIGNSVELLLRFPEQMALLKARPELIEPAIKEILKYESPIQIVRRTAATDVPVAGQNIRKNDLVLILLGAANRDPIAFEQPNQLDITRMQNKQLSFGMGIHYCLGAPLAELEAQIALRKIIERFPEMRLSNERLVYKRPFTVRGLERLPLILC